VLIALSVRGIGDALIILAVVLLVQMIIQPLVQNRMTASELDIHPVVAFGSTIIDDVFAGVLGATLSVPAVAIIIKTIGRTREYRRHRTTTRRVDVEVNRPEIPGGPPNPGPSHFPCWVSP